MIFVDICPYEDYLTPLCLNVLICKTGKTIVSIPPIVVGIKALGLISAQSMFSVIIITIIVIIIVVSHWPAKLSQSQKAR